MNRTLRGAWSRRWTLLPLLLLTVIVVGGTVAVIAFGEAARTSTTLAVPLLVLGLVAVPSTARELAEARRAEIGLARLRGVQGGQLSALASAEPLLVLTIGGVLGVVLGELGGRMAVHVLAPAATAGRPGIHAVEAGVAIVAVGLVAVVVGMAQTLNEPLSEQVRSSRRPRPSGVAAVSATVLLIVAAVVATYRASVSGPDPDVLVLAAPALVGLAVGQVVLWALQLLARVLVVTTRRRTLAGYLASRRLARVADVATPVRLVVAAASVATLAVTGATQVSTWSEETARLRAGGPERIVLDGSADDALQLTADLDPDGRYLMAAVLVPGTGGVPERRAYLDLSRFDAVLGDFYAGTPASSVGDRVDDLARAGGQSVTDALVVGARGVSRRTSGAITASVEVDYVDPTGRAASASVRLPLGLDGAETTGEVPLVGCAAGGCQVIGLTARRGDGDSARPWVIDRLDFGGADALARRWEPERRDTSDRPGGLVEVDGGLLVRSTTEPLRSRPEALDLPVLATDSATWEGPATAKTPGGDERTADVLARSAALPLVEADGLLADLRTAQAGASPTVPAAEVSVVLAADTPAALVSRLEEAGGGHVSSLEQVRQRTTVQTRATQASVYLVMAGACLLTALLALGTALARQRTAWRRDVAALRVVGVPTRTLAAAGRRELLLLGLAAAVGTAGGALLAVRLLLSRLPLVTVPDHAVLLRTSLDPTTLVAGAVSAAVVVGVAVGWGRSVAPRRSRPAILREEGAT